MEVYQRPVYNLCYRMLGEPEAAEEAAQETFYGLTSISIAMTLNVHFATWLLSIAAHYCIDCRRRRKFTITSIDQDEEERSFPLPDTGAPNPESEALHSEESRQIEGFAQTTCCRGSGSHCLALLAEFL